MKKKQKFRDIALEQIRTHKKTFSVYVVLRILVIVTLVLQLLNGNYENVFLCVLTLILFLVPSIFERKLHINMPDTLEIIILLFIFSAEILGEIQNFYNIIPHWDTILHTINGFLCAAIGFSMIDILNQSEKFHMNLSPIFVAIVGFCFSMTIGVMWEFFEYGADSIFKMDMQKDRIVENISSVLLNESGENVPVRIDNIEQIIIKTNDNSIVIDGYLDIGLIDTMKDLLVNFVGAVIFSIIGYVYVKHRGKNKFVNEFILEIRN